MTLEILEDSFLDLGPLFWAAVILGSLVVIEVFQLGPHLFERVPAKKKKGPRKGAGKFRALSSPSVDMAQFREFVVNRHFLVAGKAPHAVLFVGGGEKELVLRPLPPLNIEEVTVYPSEGEIDNYVMACGEDPELLCLQHMLSLWSAKDRSKDKDLILYCSRLPNTYAIQCISEVLAGYTNRVSVSLLYQEVSEEEEGEEEGGGMENVEEKASHLKKAHITMSKL